MYKYPHILSIEYTHFYYRVYGEILGGYIIWNGDSVTWEQNAVQRLNFENHVPFKRFILYGMDVVWKLLLSIQKLSRRRTNWHATIIIYIYRYVRHNTEGMSFVFESPRTFETTLNTILTLSKYTLRARLHTVSIKELDLIYLPISEMHIVNNI